MKMKEFLGKIVDLTERSQPNADKKSNAVLLHIQGRIYAIRNFALDPFNDTYNIILVPNAGITFNKSKFTTVDHVYYLNARKSLLIGMDNPIKLVLVDGNEDNFIPIGTIDLKEQTLTEVRPLGTGTLDTNMLYYFK